LAAAGLINLLDPELVILTGLVTYESRGLIVDLIREVILQHILLDVSRDVKIVAGALGDNGAIIGATAMAYEENFRVPIEQD